MGNPRHSQNGRGAKAASPPAAAHHNAGIDFAPAFPVLVEEMTPAGPGGAMTTGRASGAGADIGQQVQNALRDVLGWQPRANDAKGFLGALTSSFDLVEYEGHTEAKWKERRFAVQSDLSGGISGAQASLLKRARRAVEDAQPILAALYSLITNADPEEIAANRAIVSQQLDELVGELGMMGGPRVARVDQIFATLLDDDDQPDDDELDPDEIGGALGNLRRLMGLGTVSEDDPDAFETLVNNIEEEQNVTNFRILADYVIGLRQSWDDNRNHFSRSRTRPRGPRFLGTQLVQLSRQLAVVAESVGELRTILDSVFIGARERQTLEILPGFVGSTVIDADEPFFLEELLSWVESFATREGPRLIESGGKIGINGAFLQTTQRLQAMVSSARTPSNRAEIPDGYFTARVQRALHELDGHLSSLIREAQNEPVFSDLKARRAPAAGADK